MTNSPTISSGRIALLHALPESVRPICDAFTRVWPEADFFNILDDSLARDRATAGRLTETITRRIEMLGQYALQVATPSHPTIGMIFTGTAFGPAVDHLRSTVPIPVIAPHEAAFSEAAAIGGRIGLLVTFEPSLEYLEHQLANAGESRVARHAVASALVPDALAALRLGNTEDHDRLIAQAAASLDVDCYVLGQFSMARAASAVTSMTGKRAISTPDAAVRALRERLVDRNP